MGEIKITPSIIAEKGIEKKVDIYLEDNGNEEFETLSDLLEQLNSDIKYAENEGYKDKLMNTPITLQLSDIHGQIIEGRMTMSVGEVIGGNIILTGNVEGVYFLKDNNK